MILAYFDTNGASNEPTEALSGVFETMRRVARDFPNFDNYRSRALVAAGGHQPGDKPLPTLICEDPLSVVAKVSQPLFFQPMSAIHMEGPSLVSPIGFSVPAWRVMPVEQASLQSRIAQYTPRTAPPERSPYEAIHAACA